MSNRPFSRQPGRAASRSASVPKEGPLPQLGMAEHFTLTPHALATGGEAIARTALKMGCKSVAFTYNDPVIFLEYAIDVANACRALGIKTVAVTAGYMHDAARRDFYAAIDAANVDLKAFTEDFYFHQTGAHLAPVLETLRYLVRETQVWTELTTLLIPGHNDGDAELHRLSAWVRDELGPTVPLHFTAFHPDYKLTEVPATPLATLQRARRIALANGLAHVYTGNVHDREGGATACTGCGELLIERDWHAVTRYELDVQGACPHCGTALAGRFGTAAGHFGRRRIPVRVAMR